MLLVRALSASISVFNAFPAIPAVLRARNGSGYPDDPDVHDTWFRQAVADCHLSVSEA